MDIKEDEKRVKAQIKESITKLRVANELTQEEVAQALGKNASSYRSWESLNRNASPNHYWIKRMADMYRVSTDLIYYGEDSASPAHHFTVQASDDYNQSIYGDPYLSELSSSEKILIMQIRQLNSKDRQTVMAFIADILPKDNE